MNKENKILVVINAILLCALLVSTKIVGDKDTFVAENYNQLDSLKQQAELVNQYAQKNKELIEQVEYLHKENKELLKKEPTIVNIVDTVFISSKEIEDKPVIRVDYRCYDNGCLRRFKYNPDDILIESGQGWFGEKTYRSIVCPYCKRKNYL